ncbi:MAG: sigma-54-dependent Fis family transcriptional regulator [Rhizobiaceae bacterium]|nr:sigma-54-dependent Fis family transcriptional regulator [Rhizobiaceae bacterium]
MERIARKKEWEDFMSTGQAPVAIRHDVLESWRRSLRHSIAERTRAPVLDEERLEVRRARARRLEHASQKAMHRAGNLLIGTRDILLLSDDSGVVIEAAGDPHTLADAQENHLYPGGQWIEEAIGTNAIGTALYLGVPTLIRDAEHFCEAIQRWNCAATPIIEPGTGRVMGVLDISWPGGIMQPNAVALSSALALQVETELTQMLGRERERLLEYSHIRRLRRGNDQTLVMDRNGSSVFSTEDFARFCEDDEALRELPKLLPALINRPAEQIGEVLGECLNGADFEVIETQGEAIGIMVSLRRSRPQASNWAGMELQQIARAGQVSAELCAQAQRLAETPISILIEGETGTGKNSLAKAIHHASSQSQGPFEVIDCAQLTEDALRTLIASARDTDAGGILCLSSPGAISPSLQKLLFTLVELVSERGGRIIALSARSLYDEMRANNFRSDLYYRIAGARLHIPPLRERPEEIGPLLRRLVQSHAKETGRRELRFTSGAMAALQAYAWPGNLLEMRNLITALDALSPSGLITERTLPREFHQRARSDRTETLRDVERAEILGAVKAEDGNLSRVAKRLGIARSTLYLKLDSYGISRERKD